MAHWQRLCGRTNPAHSFLFHYSIFSYLYSPQIFQIFTSNISYILIFPFHRIAANPMLPIFSPQLITAIPPSCCLCSLLRGWTLQNQADRAQFFLGSLDGPSVVVLVVVASVMVDATINTMCFPAGNHRALCRVIGSVRCGVEMGRQPSSHSMWTSPRCPLRSSSTKNRSSCRPASSRWTFPNIPDGGCWWLVVGGGLVDITPMALESD